MCESKSTIHTKLKIGSIEVDISCRQDQLQDTVAGLINVFISKMQGLDQISIASHSQQGTCMSSLKILLSEGLFSTKKYVRDVQLELLRRGLHYHRSAVSHCLEDLCKEGLLTKEGTPRRYTFTKRDIII